MPTINNADASKVLTPLQTLFQQLIDACLRLSPESSSVAKQVIAERGIHFVVDGDSNEFIFYATATRTSSGPKDQEVHIGLHATERAWAFFFSFYTVFKWLSDRHNAAINKRTTPPPIGLLEALGTLEWALKGPDLSKSIREPYPKELVSPANPLADAAFMQDVSNAAIRAFGIIELHELGHFKNGDLDGPPWKTLDHHKIEFAADSWAVAQATTPYRAGLSDTSGNLVAAFFAQALLAGLNPLESLTHPSFVKRVSRLFADHVEPIRKKDSSLYNTTLFAAMAPLQAMLFLKRGDMTTSTPATFDTFDDYLAWWEKEYSK